MDGVDRFSSLPEGCISLILSFTSPRAAGKSASISSVFRYVSESDLVWERFLPSDYSDILARSDYPVEFSSKKELYFRLCDSIIIDNGQLCFSLEKMTGKKCYMLSARKLVITWGDTQEYWNWTSLPDSRFPEVAELLEVCLLGILGNIKAHWLSLETTYKVYLVMNIGPRAFGLGQPAAKMLVRVGDQISNHRCNVRLSHEQVGDERFPQARSDGWMEIKMGEFFNEEGKGEVEMHFIHEGLHWKSGLIVEGIEIRPS